MDNDLTDEERIELGQEDEVLEEITERILRACKPLRFAGVIIAVCMVYKELYLNLGINN